MSLNGIGNLPPGIPGGLPLAGRPGANERTRANADAAAPAPVATPAATRAQAARAAQRAGGALPAEAPAGTDPELWKILTSDERQHFATAGARGPLTYGHLARSQPPQELPVSRGARLDLRA